MSLWNKNRISRYLRFGTRFLLSEPIDELSLAGNTIGCFTDKTTGKPLLLGASSTVAPSLDSIDLEPAPFFDSSVLLDFNEKRRFPGLYGKCFLTVIFLFCKT